MMIDPEFSNLNSDMPPGLMFVDHIAIAVCHGELEKQLEMYKLIGFRYHQIHRFKSRLIEMEAGEG